ncbi:MAG TPA: NRDE family protein, partial [Gemmataceae bacterium]|nr:NRDE family protein [Gemmataceae bacterium]
LGLNAYGLLVAVTNRAKSRPPDRPRSRGLLARDLLACESATAAVEKATAALDTDEYAGCNLVCADADTAAVIHAGDWLRVRLLPPGIHVLANRDVNDASDARVLFALDWLARRPYRCVQQAVTALEELCARCGEDGPAMCIRATNRGTVSSSIVAARAPLASGVYLHAQGPPDVTPYEDYSHLLRELNR